MSLVFNQRIKHLFQLNQSFTLIDYFPIHLLSIIILFHLFLMLQLSFKTFLKFAKTFKNELKNFPLTIQLRMKIQLLEFMSN